MTARVWQLRTSGFRKLMPGHIHLRCPHCGRKQSNMRRGKYDPPKAMLAETLCERCCVSLGALEPGVEYYDAKGNSVAEVTL